MLDGSHMPICSDVMHVHFQEAIMDVLAKNVMLMLLLVFLKS